MRTSRTPSVRRLAMLALAGALGLAACGSSGGGGAASSDTTKAAAGESKGGSSGDMGEGLVAAFKAVEKGDCGKAANIGNEFDAVGDAEAMNAMGGLVDGLEQLAKEGPSELRADFTTMAKAFDGIAKVYEELDLSDPAKITEAMQDPEKAKKIAEMGAAMDGPEVGAAGERISAWINKRCPGQG